MNSIKEEFKDMFKEFAFPDCDEMLGIDKVSYLNLLDSIDQYHNEVVSQISNELERERMRLTACGVAALGYFDGCKEEYKSASLDDVLKAQERIEELEGKNRELLELLEESLEHLENCSVFNNEIVPKVQSIIANYKGGDGEESN